MRLGTAPGEHYHLFDRGTAKQEIFLDKRDYARFLFLILHCQSSVAITNTSHYVNSYIKHSVFNIRDSRHSEILANRIVALVAFAIMPNHFHLIVEQISDNGISEYMHRVLMGYAKYFNTKYEKSGHVFQGPYQAVHVSDNEQLLHLSAYVHKNPNELLSWKGKEEYYPWSSLQDFTQDNRWGALLKNDIIVQQFRDKAEYRKFVRTSSAKESEFW